jgi:hypothetical protein
MNLQRRSAVDLLLSHQDHVVAEMLGIRLLTLRQWMADDEFAAALAVRESEQRRSLTRIARQAATNAASTLSQISAEPGKADTKLLLDLVKASGAFDEQETDPTAALAEMIELAARPDAGTGEPRGDGE